ncbi:MAG: UvrD-helicase domain-containing protein [Endomicrobium sp.]|jgi:DNA helicase-2/ATP-dependent DNA helicase PcrA|nr:UvrD-helicase domain-containing protein [Endomicrobium sp.]
MKEILTKNLNPSQIEAVHCTEGPLIIFAGAGTGKTKVITYRIAHLLSLGIAPWSILAVTFTNKAASEMKKRVTNLISQTHRNLWISTFHSFCAYFLRIEASKISLDPNFLIYDFMDQKNTIKDCIKELNIDEKKFKVSTIVNKISRAKDDLKFPSDVVSEAEQLDNPFEFTISKIYELYQKKLKKTGALDFGDLIMQTVATLQQLPAMLERYQEKFKYIMIDEYQDTNRAQYILIKLLARKHHNVCVVGDDDQSVYSWRGADINNILNFKKDYPNAKSVKLEQNYRSTPKILSTAYQVVKHNNTRIDKQLWTENLDNGSVIVIKAVNENDEATKIANLISLNAYKHKLSNFAVFYRTNSQSRTFEDTFRRAGIPYALIGALRFYERTEIKDIIAYLKLINNPNDNVSFKRIINIPRRGIGKTSIESLEKFALLKNISLWEAIHLTSQADLTKGAQKALNSFMQFIETFLELKKKDISAKIISEKIVTHSGYLKELEAENTPESKTKIENIQELISAINDFQNRSQNKSLAGYLTQIALTSDTDSLDESKDKVTLMTLHLAKGLEFEYVFICGLEEGLFPIWESVSNNEELEEERRLMYVGMTRAKKNLYLCWSTERTIYGKTRWNIPSRFITEAGFKYDFTGSKQNPNFKNTNKKHFRAEVICEDTYNNDFEIKTGPFLSTIKTANPYKVGATVLHPTFGRGKIIEQSGTRENLKLIVLFENGQQKKLIAKIANLRFI